MIWIKRRKIICRWDLKGTYTANRDGKQKDVLHPYTGIKKESTTIDKDQKGARSTIDIDQKGTDLPLMG